MNKFYFLTLLLPLCTLVQAQQFYLKGEVKDEGGNPLQNVAIVHSRTGYVYYSGATGSFGLVSNRKTDTLVFSLDGYQKQTAAIDASVFRTIVMKKSSDTKNTRTYKLTSFTKDLKKETQQQWFAGDETYASIVENRFVDARQYPNTGLTLNVDRASYSNIRRFVHMNTIVPPDAVRIEEMLNYFNLDYKEPPPDKTFSISATLTSCPWNAENQLLFASIQSKKVKPESLPPSHLVFLIDVSGSMDMPNRLPLLKSGFRGLVHNLRQKDSVSIVVYGGTVAIMLNPTSGAEKDKIFAAIDSITPGGSTPGESGLKMAYRLARNHFIKGGNNRVILATDGDFNVGVRSEEELEELITQQKQYGIYLTCLGVGMGNYKDSKIQTLAQKGNGNFAYLDSYAESEKVLLKEFMQTLYAVADDAYLEVVFDPKFVREYRLIGFDNKMGAIREGGTSLEGGEVGSAYTVMIAFEINPTAAGNTNMDYFQPAVFSLSYKLPNSTKSLNLRESPRVQFQSLQQAPKFYRLASSLIFFGSILRGSPYIKKESWNELVALTTTAIDQQVPLELEFLDLVQRAKVIYTRRKKKLFD